MATRLASRALGWAAALTPSAGAEDAPVAAGAATAAAAAAARDEWSAAVAALREVEPREAARVERFRRREDAVRAVVARAALRVVAADALGVEPSAVVMGRTDANKPFVVSGAASAEANAWNVNATHHGEWVAAACHPRLLVGVDVMRFEEPPRGRVAFLEAFAGHFTASEWSQIRRLQTQAASVPDDTLHMFYTFWALKEAYIKAIGIGLGFALQRISFTLSAAPAGSAVTHVATAELDGAPAVEWHFDVSRLDAEHVVAVALGPRLCEDPLSCAVTPVQRADPAWTSGPTPAERAAALATRFHVVDPAALASRAFNLDLIPSR